MPTPTDPPTLEATERILQEIASVGRRLEAMDLKITDLTVTSSSIRADIAGFKDTADALDQRHCSGGSNGGTTGSGNQTTIPSTKVN
ncbi:hypothetical protein NDU88_003033 [Pleurodeles waltl]|uniref:Uncharacterized protein n=1 Tax=Pleurodeles waltl TaxID=8319 RepID=A0AAV7VF78_PLEWA|nr:hypothetical protein NDU88_003033 [Pleurodeles waltl]